MDVIIAFLIVTAIISIGFFSNYFFNKTKIPDLIWLIFFGLLIGPILGIIKPETLFTFVPIFSAIALLIILFEGGTNIDIYKLFKESFNIFFLSFLGFILSVFIAASLSYYFFNFSPLLSLLLGAIVGGTSSPVVVSFVGGLRSLKKEVPLILKMESIITDTLVIIVSLVFIQIILFSPAQSGIQVILSRIASSFSISIVIGFVVGVVWGAIWYKFIRYKFHYMLTIAVLFLFYSLSEMIGGSGAIVAFMIGLVLGNIESVKRMLRIRHKIAGLSKEIRHFNSYISFFVRTFFFVLIGTLISLSRIDLILYGLLISLGLVAVRYFAVKIATFDMKINDVEQGYMTFIYPRGLAAAVLASLVFLQYKIPGTENFIEIVFSVIFFSVIISTLGVYHMDHKYKKKVKKGEITPRKHIPQKTA